MKIRGIPHDIPQFIVHKPTMHLQTSFKEKKRSSGSKLMFHGTPLPNLQPILQNGFEGGRDGMVYAAKEPSLSISYALKGRRVVEGFRRGPMFGARAGDFGFEHIAKQYENIAKSPYGSYGALLGCEYAASARSRGRGRLLRSPGGKRAGGEIDFDAYHMSATHDHYAIMVRYVFLIPPGPDIFGAGGFGGTGSGNIGQRHRTTFPKRSHIKPQMLENMERIERRIERRTREG
jgi:hypothetical protein